MDNLTISPVTASAGIPVAISFKVTNIGLAAGTYSVNLRVGGVVEATATGSLAIGVSKTHIFSAWRTAAGTYSVEADGAVGSFTIPPAVIRLSDLSVAPRTVGPKDRVEATARATNMGGAAGSRTVTFTVAGAAEATATMLLNPAAFDLLYFTTSREPPGTHPVALDGLSSDFTVIAPVTVVPTTTGVLTTALSVDLRKDDPTVGQVSISVSADIKRLPVGAKLEFIPKKTLPEGVKAGFELLARAADGTIADVGAAIEIKRENLANVTDVGEVTLKMCLGAAWVTKMGGVGRIKGAHLADDGTLEFLETIFLGTDAQGRMCFDMKSPKGFSIFALLAVVPLPPAFEVSQLSIKPEVAAPGQLVKISILMTNKGGASGTYNVLLTLNGRLESSKPVTLDTGASDTVVFFIKKDVVGTYQVQVDGMRGSFGVAVALPTEAVSISQLKISPEEVKPDEPVTISVLATNALDQAGKADITLKVNELIEEIKSVILPARGSVTVEFLVAKKAFGTYKVEVHGLVGSFKVARILRRATFTVSDLRVEPAKVGPGKPVAISAMVNNLGDEEGTYTAVLTINNAVVEEKTVTVEALTSITVTFTVVRDEPGEYRVRLDSQESSFVVEKKPFPIWIPIVIALGILALLALGAYLWRRRVSRA